MMTTNANEPSDKFRQPQSSPDEISGLWANISHSLCASVEAVVSFERPPKRNQWHDEEEECRAASAVKSVAYKRTLQSAATREEIEMYKSRNDAQKVFKNVNRLTEGFKPAASSCRDERGNLVTDAHGVIVKRRRD